jgi:sugar transferase (PEP-CTERM/EpsH1 system associated)
MVSRRRILYLTHRVPYPLDKGERIRCYHILRYLARRADVDLACLADEPVAAETIDTLQQHCRRLHIERLGCWSRWRRVCFALLRGGTASEGAFASPELQRLLAAWGHQHRYHAILASSSSMAQFLRSDSLSDVPAIVDLIDVDSQKWLDYAAASAGPRSWLYRLEANRLRRLEAEIARWARRVVVINQAEARWFRRHCPNAHPVVVSNGVDVDRFRPVENSIAQRLVFVGVLNYRPNVDGITRFCREVWPMVLERYPQATLEVVGRKPSAEVRKLALLSGVRVAADVPDVRPFLATAQVVITPLRIARGQQNKVLEALAMARPVIASSPVLRGLDAEPDRDVLQADSPSEWLDAISTLFEDVGLRERLGRAGRSFVERHHRWEQCLAGLDKLLGLDGHLQPRDVPQPQEAHNG